MNKSIIHYRENWKYSEKNAEKKGKIFWGAKNADFPIFELNAKAHEPSRDRSSRTHHYNKYWLLDTTTGQTLDSITDP